MRKVFLSLLVLSIPWRAEAKPAQILLLRHAEKPDEGPHLSPRGWERARALPKFFRDRSEINRYGLPAALFAMGPSKESDEETLGGSVRAIETLQFLGQEIGLPVNSQFKKNDVVELVQSVLASPSLDGRLVVICWEHKVLSDIAAELGVRPIPDYPGKKFDRAWLITLKEGAAPGFEDLPERLLPGDDER